MSTPLLLLLGLVAAGSASLTYIGVGIYNEYYRGRTPGPRIVNFRTGATGQLVTLTCIDDGGVKVVYPRGTVVNIRVVGDQAPDRWPDGAIDEALDYLNEITRQGLIDLGP